MRNYKKTNLKDNPAINFKTILFFLTIPFCFFQSAYGFTTTEEISNNSFATKESTYPTSTSYMAPKSTADNGPNNTFYILAKRIYSAGNDPAYPLQFNSNERYPGMQMVGATNAAGINAIAIGLNNVASGHYSTAIGGRGNTATDTYATSIGSHLQASDKGATGYHSGIYSAYNGLASNNYSVVLGGLTNTALGYGSVVIGGTGSTAEGQYSAVVASPNSSITSAGGTSGIFAGQNHSVSGANSAVIAGKGNTASGYGSAVIGGGAASNSTAGGNTASGESSIVAGGQSNQAQGQYSGVFAGKGNIASGYGSAVIGGDLNTASGSHSIVAGGKSNTVNQTYAGILGGSSNSISESAQTSVILGGSLNINTRNYSAVVAGSLNQMKSQESLIAGRENEVYGGSDYSFVVGENNLSAGRYQFIAGQGIGIPRNYMTAFGKYPSYPTLMDNNANTLNGLDMFYGSYNIYVCDFNSYYPTLEGTRCLHRDWPELYSLGARLSSTITYSPKYNTDPLSDHYLFTVGNGTNTNARNNAFSVSRNGIITYTGSWNTSDKRLKTNFKPYKAGLKEILALNPVHFTWKRWQTQTVGLIAQDVYKVLPDLVQKGDDDENAKDWTEIKQEWSMSYDKIPLVLINAVKENQAIIEKNQQTIEQTEQVIKRLEAEIAQLKQEKNI